MQFTVLVQVELNFHLLSIMFTIERAKNALSKTEDDVITKIFSAILFPAFQQNLITKELNLLYYKSVFFANVLQQISSHSFLYIQDPSRC